MVLGWIDLFKRRWVYRHEFVSADARRLSNDPRTYEMLTSTLQPNLKSPDAAAMSPLSPHSTPISPNADSKNDYFGRTTRAYLSPAQSFSTPRPPSSGRRGCELGLSTRNDLCWNGTRKDTRDISCLASRPKSKLVHRRWRFDGKGVDTYRDRCSRLICFECTYILCT